MEIVVKNGTCTCHQHHKCIKNKVASQPRCTEQELKDLGYMTIDTSNVYKYYKMIGENKGWKKGFIAGCGVALIILIIFLLK